MKKLLAVTAVLAFSCFAANAEAQNAAPTPAPAASTAAPASTAAKPATAQQSKMKTCAGQYHQQNIPKNQYHSFMSGCMKGQPYTPTAASAAAPKPAAPVATSASSK